MSQVRSLELLSFEKLWWSVACSQYIWSCLLIIPALIEGASNKVEGHYCGLFEGRKYLTTLLLPRSELIQPEDAHMVSKFRGFFITNPKYSTEIPRILLRLYFGISEIDCYDYRGDRIRTCDLVLPKHWTPLDEHWCYKLYLRSCVVLRYLSCQTTQELTSN